jgi:hypothetical protein
MPNYCKGCYTYHYYDNNTLFSNGCIHSQYNEGLCPCTDCVVKMMCNSPCEKYVRYNLILKEGTIIEA